MSKTTRQLFEDASTQDCAADELLIGQDHALVGGGKLKQAIEIIEDLLEQNRRQDEWTAWAYPVKMPEWDRAWGDAQAFVNGCEPPDLSV